ncbi:hypothetical protein [Brevibacillus porteri]|uniref:Uncharacterized protein n=1 Tax=Brevibacillus porteri TaxID=2126350 RepID=A0ABX5FFY4_9BACL|nr:hypothetical protein [Brevibacillus porteri]MED1802244.1 hypothetical protein [Brevibacillus porteri]MED2130009.1 hypothetical protein [Brevibacillus porteri]MED2745753.1 hypothetical protein [Brevibacillus porteri]MED2816637.1 hypothetical protein [Brevibacillus porteri]MED2897360.1 hypothetical protein [Brevibacillus porteri]
MDKKLSSIFSFLLGLAVIIGSLIAIYFLFKTFWETFKELQPPVAGAFITGFVTIIVAVVSLILAKRYELKKEIEQSHRSNKLPLYEEFLVFYFRLLMSIRTGETSIAP